MERQRITIDEALDQMQTETRARGLLQLQQIFGSLFLKETLLSALDSHSLNTEQAALYLQDNLPIHLPALSPVLPHETPEDHLDFSACEERKFVPEHKQIPGPTTGKIALEFSLSSQYVDATVPVIYLVDEIVKEILSFLPAWERAKMACVCKTWKMIDEVTGYLYKRDCLKHWVKTARPGSNVFFHPFNNSAELWGEEFPKGYGDSKEYLKGLKTWRNMWLKRPRVRINGVYVARVAFVKQGQINFDNLPSFQRIVFYRYLRFYEDFSVCSFNTSVKPREFLKNVQKSHPDARVGEWARAGEKLTVHLLAKNEIFTYRFDLKSSQSHHHDLLKLNKLETRSASALNYSTLNFNNNACPKYFKFTNLKF